MPITRGVGGPGLRNSCALCCGSGDALRHHRRLHRCSLSPRARGGLHSAADCRARSRGSRVDRLHCTRQQDPNFADQTSARPRPTRLILSLTHLPRGSFPPACTRQVQALVSFFFTLKKRGDLRVANLRVKEGEPEEGRRRDTGEAGHGLLCSDIETPTTSQHPTMSWHAIATEQLFTQSPIPHARGEQQLFAIDSDEATLRDAWHTQDARQAHHAVLKTVLQVATEGLPVCTRGPASPQSAGVTENWLKTCQDRATREVAELARGRRAPKFELRVKRKDSHHGKGGTRCDDLDAGALLLGVVGDELEHEPGVTMCDLAGHLIFVPLGHADKDEHQSNCGDYYIVWFNQSSFELRGLVSLRCFCSAARAPSSKRLPSSKVAKHAQNKNYFASLGDEKIEDPLKSKIVEVLDLHGHTVAEALSKVEEVLAEHAPRKHLSTTATPEANVRHINLMVGIGKHSENGTPQIKPEVQKLLSKRGISHSMLRDNAGIICVDVHSIPPSCPQTEATISVLDLGYIGNILDLLMTIQTQLRKATWPRISNALADPTRRALLPATLFKGRCALKDLQLPADAKFCNEHQLKAMRSITHNVTAIQGPPGTGKTSLIANILEHGIPQLTTLVTCVQNKALEPIAQKLAEANVNFLVVADGNKVIKLGDVSRGHTLSALASRQLRRPFATGMVKLCKLLIDCAWTVPQDRDATHLIAVENTVEAEPSNWRRIVTMKLEHLERRRVEEIWRSEVKQMILSDTTVFLSTIDSAHAVHRLLLCSGKAFDAIIVDEAGTVPEWKMPGLTACAGEGSGPELMILVGDQNQLPPFSSSSRESPKSVLERMVHVLPEKSVEMLKIQYRMPSEICDLLSRHFYDGRLETAPCKGNTQISPIKWFNHNHHESHEGTSKYNEREIDMIVATLTTSKCATSKKLAQETLKLKKETVIVITFYSEQTRRLQKLLNTDRPDVRIMTVDSAQGSESDYVLMSCVRCNKRGQVGHVADHRRVNVAMSRARKQLIVFGSAKTLLGRGESTTEVDIWRETYYAAQSGLRPRLPHGREQTG